jgi:hypothetical protein
MFKKIAAGLGVAVVATTVAYAHGSAPKTHVEAQQYTHSYGVVAAHHYRAALDDEMPGLFFKPMAGDRSVTIDSADADGQHVIVHVYQPSSMKGMKPLDDEFCDPSASFNLVGSKPVEVWVYDGACDNHDFGWASQGTIKATFSTAPYGGPEPMHMHHHPY